MGIVCKTQPPPRSLHKRPRMHTISPQTEKGLVVFIHLFLIKNAFLMPEKDPICFQRETEMGKQGLGCSRGVGIPKMKKKLKVDKYG